MKNLYKATYKTGKFNKSVYVIARSHGDAEDQVNDFSIYPEIISIDKLDGRVIYNPYDTEEVIALGKLLEKVRESNDDEKFIKYAEHLIDKLIKILTKKNERIN